MCDSCPICALRVPTPRPTKQQIAPLPRPTFYSYRCDTHGAACCAVKQCDGPEAHVASGNSEAPICLVHGSQCCRGPRVFCLIHELREKTKVYWQTHLKRKMEPDSEEEAKKQKTEQDSDSMNGEESLKKLSLLVA